ncbi:hypothetical protein, partial [Mesorhizobium sp. M7D.F.Ca.US.004.03.1.1]|uniref:hypothetical protein n=1 Tax=Mesorhizobium sp. M7D.F.Ca.US.004.03.1.1 TaxID=2496702 RepID=UPI0019D24C2A
MPRPPETVEQFGFIAVAILEKREHRGCEPLHVRLARLRVKFAFGADPIKDALAQLQIGRMEAGIALVKARHEKPLSEQRPICLTLSIKNEIARSESQYQRHHRKNRTILPLKFGMLSS